MTVLMIINFMQIFLTTSYDKNQFRENKYESLFDFMFYFKKKDYNLKNHIKKLL